ncbi:MAG: hypothetical protein KKF44_06570 [Nanoarchaeota archaeon]|nr:hypothetical protein [Nanoarchaeota archaeon]
MSFLVEYDSQPVKFLKKQEKKISKRILDKIDELFKDTEIPQGSTAIVGEHVVYRV